MAVMGLITFCVFGLCNKVFAHLILCVDFFVCFVVHSSNATAPGKHAVSVNRLVSESTCAHAQCSDFCGQPLWQFYLTGAARWDGFKTAYQTNIVQRSGSFCSKKCSYGVTDMGIEGF